MLLSQRQRLDLSDEQVRRLEALKTPTAMLNQADMLRARADLMEATRGDGNLANARTAMERMSRLRNEHALAQLKAHQDVRSVLTATQRQTLDAMRGNSMRGGAVRGSTMRGGAMRGNDQRGVARRRGGMQPQRMGQGMTPGALQGMRPGMRPGMPMPPGGRMAPMPMHRRMEQTPPTPSMRRRVPDARRDERLRERGIRRDS